MITQGMINLKPVAFYAFETEHLAKYRDDDLGIQVETITPKSRKTGKFLKGKSFFFIDNDPREFLSIDKLIEAYNEKFERDGDGPDSEVKYIKVVKKRK
jgi:hypothetical protein